MTLHWKLLAAASGGAFLLSFLAGLLGNVGIGTVFLRALIWAIIFGGLAFGIEHVLRNYLPELFVGSDRSSPEGNAVDITLDDENPHVSAEEGEGAAKGYEQADTGSRSEEDLDDFAEDAEDNGHPLPGEFSEERSVGSASDGVDDENDVEDLEAVSDGGEISDSELPSFDSVESTFTSAETDDSERGAGLANVDVLGSEEDPEVVARAVRTLMNKDREG